MKNSLITYIYLSLLVFLPASSWALVCSPPFVPDAEGLNCIIDSSPSGIVMGNTFKLIVPLEFPDGSFQSTATQVGLTGPPGPQGPQGVPGLDGLPGPAGICSGACVGSSVNNADLHLTINDFKSTWFTNADTWVSFSPIFSISFNKAGASSALKIMWSDNVGVYGSSWCSVGVFIDNGIEPACVGSWSGVSGTSIFGQQSLVCVLRNVVSGVHAFEVRHRSDYCVYGNYSVTAGYNRFLLVEEL